MPDRTCPVAEPVDVANRADQELGAALRRALRGRPERHWFTFSYSNWGGRMRFSASTHDPAPPGGRPDVERSIEDDATEALEKLTAELERRSLLEPNRGES